MPCVLSGHLNQLNAILSLLYPSTAIGPPRDRECLCLVLSCIHAQVGSLDRLILNHLGPRNSGAIPSKFLDYIHRTLSGNILICKRRPEIT